MEIEEDQFELDKSFLDPATQDDPFEAYDELRQHCPVYKLPETGLFMVTRYEDVREVLTTSSVFSSRPGAGAGGANEASKAHAAVFSEKGWVKARTLQRTDPPEHTQYRKILGRDFTNRSARRGKESKKRHGTSENKAVGGRGKENERSKRERATRKR